MWKQNILSYLITLNINTILIFNINNIKLKKMLITELIIILLTLIKYTKAFSSKTNS